MSGISRHLRHWMRSRVQVTPTWTLVLSSSYMNNKVVICCTCHVNHKNFWLHAWVSEWVSPMIMTTPYLLTHDYDHTLPINP